MGHRLDESVLITPSLLRRFQAEAEFEGGPGAYYAYIQKSDGAWLVHPMGPHPSAEQALFALDMLPLLNKEFHHDGAWVLVFTHPKPYPPGALIAVDDRPGYGRFLFMWMDEDGDIRFPVECDDTDFTNVLASGAIHWCEQCETAWQVWHYNVVEVLEPRPQEQFKRALGERPPSAR